MIYVVFLSLWCIVISSVIKCNEVKGKVKVLSLCFCPLIIFVGTRLNWLPDDLQYEIVYELCNGSDAESVLYQSRFLEREQAWYLLNILCPSQQLLQFIVSAFFLSSVACLFYYYIPTRVWLLAFSLFFYNRSFYENLSAQRSSIVVACFIFAIILRNKGKYYIPIGLVLLSSFFHRSGFLLLPIILVPISIIAKNFKYVSAIVIIIITVCLLNPVFFNELLSAFLEENETLSSYSQYAVAQTHTLGYFVMQLFLIFLTVLLLVLCNRYKDNCSFVYLGWLTIIDMLLSIIPDIGIGRIHSFFVLPILAFIGQLVNNYRVAESKAFIIGYVVTVIYGFYSFYQTLPMFGGKIIVYNSYIFN